MTFPNSQIYRTVVNNEKVERTMSEKHSLVIEDLHVSIEGQEILKGVNLQINGGEIHVIMGPNGTGKSTLSSVLMGHPSYKEHSGRATLDGRDLFAMTVDERARAGLFLAMQYPAEIAGVRNSDFLRSAVNARREKNNPVGVFPFRRALNAAAQQLEMRADLPERYLNEGFSGGEKKRNEILQMLLLRPHFAILDEIDSGLDIDALRIVGENVTRLAKEQGNDMGLLLITHYQRLLDYIRPDFVHVLMDGRIVRSGGPELALRLEKEGYDWLRKELEEEELDESSARAAEPQVTQNINSDSSAQMQLDEILQPQSAGGEFNSHKRTPEASGKSNPESRDRESDRSASPAIRHVTLEQSAVKSGEQQVLEAALTEKNKQPFTVEDAFALKTQHISTAQRELDQKNNGLDVLI